jgi:hypothetical protein
MIIKICNSAVNLDGVRAITRERVDGRTYGLLIIFNDRDQLKVGDYPDIDSANKDIDRIIEISNMKKQ